ncbi:hypothetical protein [Synechococcus elongatus]|uniref:hypothetical protein n=1 Tax=Synechococcus elongatus TaxID=32046 RepID=UPI000F7EDBEC|nr:hypothetical protein [Synechococcus elongatus]
MKAKLKEHTVYSVELDCYQLEGLRYTRYVTSDRRLAETAQRWETEARNYYNALIDYTRPPQLRVEAVATQLVDLTSAAKRSLAEALVEAADIEDAANNSDIVYLHPVDTVDELLS